LFKSFVLATALLKSRVAVADRGSRFIFILVLQGRKRGS